MTGSGRRAQLRRSLRRARTLTGRSLQRVLPGGGFAVLRSVRDRARGRWHRGDAVECPVCERSYARFLPRGRRTAAVCPGCGSMERHRMAWLYLRQLTGPAGARLRVLHFGPEPHLGGRLRSLPGVDYVTADLLREDVDLRLDVTDMPEVPDGEFDVVLAADVLEHVDDDRRAMRELLRITRPDGCALLPTPVEEDRPATYEDWSITTPAGRAAAFGQADHVRRYGRDFPELLREQGWAVVPVPMPLSAEESRRFGVPPDEQRLYLATPAAPPA